MQKWHCDSDSGCVLFHLRCWINYHFFFQAKGLTNGKTQGACMMVTGGMVNAMDLAHTVFQDLEVDTKSSIQEAGKMTKDMWGLIYSSDTYDDLCIYMSCHS